MVYVTHDQLEAMTMADRIAVMDHGQAAASGHTARNLQRSCGSTFVAQIHRIAPGMNILKGELSLTDDSLAM